MELARYDGAPHGRLRTEFAGRGTELQRSGPVAGAGLEPRLPVKRHDGNEEIDLHRADAASVSDLLQLAPDLAHAPLLLIGTWRDTELDDSALRPALPALDRHARTI